MALWLCKTLISEEAESEIYEVFLSVLFFVILVNSLKEKKILHHDFKG